MVHVRSNTVGLSQTLLHITIDLDKRDVALTSELSCKGFVDRSDSFARSAPISVDYSLRKMTILA